MDEESEREGAVVGGEVGEWSIKGAIMACLLSKIKTTLLHKVFGYLILYCFKKMI